MNERVSDCCLINVREYRRGNTKKNNPENLATQVTKDETNQNTTQYMLDTTIRKQTQIT